MRPRCAGLEGAFRPWQTREPKCGCGSWPLLRTERLHRSPAARCLDRAGRNGLRSRSSSACAWPVTWDAAWVPASSRIVVPEPQTSAAPGGNSRAGLRGGRRLPPQDALRRRQRALHRVLRKRRLPCGSPVLSRERPELRRVPPFRRLRRSHEVVRSKVERLCPRSLRNRRALTICVTGNHLPDTSSSGYLIP